MAAHTYGDWTQNNDDTHTRVFTSCGIEQTAACTGGKATCTDKAVPATHSAAGNIAYWRCEGCGKCYADAGAKTEIALADTILEKLPGHTAGDGGHSDESEPGQPYAPGEKPGTNEPKQTGNAITRGAGIRPEPALTDGRTDPGETGPATGDNSQPVLWFALLAVSGLGIAAPLVLRSRKRQ